MAEKTKKMIEAELTEVKQVNENMVAQYNQLMEQAQAVQAQSANRLIFIRLFEGAFNEIQAVINKLQNDIGELNAQARMAQEQNAAAEEEEGDV